ncbi:pyridoxamine 5'-phosphate oxidase family protein [Arthrobacter sp.]|uniref:pyridoxamine 5'-phosphate oxidase family protein n=1 Tax=Arthrobacter sp. TaxID=1667 RepID=UPI0026E0423D|nr:pyridoxamine 5'-phosphate oxidase family protein [Arthrobacter sp.]MDO5753126.1 pyridoxamine 5'-phosphate oxidase family protein [Arthrobacter sp.]
MNHMERPRVDTLEKAECWDLLKSHVIGRLAVVVDGHPDIFPLNYAVGNGHVVFRTAGGTKLQGAIDQALVALEIDGYDDRSEHAWSVVLRGTAREITHPAEVSAANALPLEPWQGGTKAHLVRIDSLSLSGRRFPVTKPDIWKTPVSDPRRSTFE